MKLTPLPTAEVCPSIYSKEWIKSPPLSLGSNQVDLGGMTWPVSAMDISASMLGKQGKSHPSFLLHSLLQFFQTPNPTDKINARVSPGILNP